MSTDNKPKPQPQRLTPQARSALTSVIVKRIERTINIKDVEELNEKATVILSLKNQLSMEQQVLRDMCHNISFVYFP